MPRVIFVAPDGGETTAAGDAGQSVMEVARRHGIDGILAECGGSCACATCQVYIAPKWQSVVGPPSSDEADMLSFAWKPKPESRLSCQIRLRLELDGLVVGLPAHQR
jgi:2Fe-2S ferredoxin